jgi:dephospho-CoA kinase
VLRIGLTGGIGAGKSEAAGRLADHGAVVIDADRLAREVVAPGTDGLREVVAAFGPAVVGPGGALDRAALAKAVFDDEPARRRLEGIIHPRVRARTAALTRAAPPDAVVVNDVPLLVEVGLAPSYHLVIVVAAAEATRVERLTRHRGMSEAEAWARLRAQTGDAERRAAADVVLANDGTPAELHAAVDALWRDRLVPYEENVRLRRPASRPARVRLAPYDPTWPDQYRRLAARIGHAAGEAALRVDHIGSTAVPGLAAKDVIDVQLTVADLAEADAVADRLAEAGFPRLPGVWRDRPKPDAPDPAGWEKRVHAGADPGRAANLHVRAAGSPGWRLSLLLRDWLRADPAARAEYTTLKRRLTARGGATGAYQEAKEPWFDEVWPRARRWAAETGWRP